MAFDITRIPDYDFAQAAPPKFEQLPPGIYLLELDEVMEDTGDWSSGQAELLVFKYKIVMGPSNGTEYENRQVREQVTLNAATMQFDKAKPADVHQMNMEKLTMMLWALGGGSQAGADQIMTDPVTGQKDPCNLVGQRVIGWLALDKTKQYTNLKAVVEGSPANVGALASGAFKAWNNVPKLGESGGSGVMASAPTAPVGSPAAPIMPPTAPVAAAAPVAPAMPPTAPAMPPTAPVAAPAAPEAAEFYLVVDGAATAAMTKSQVVQAISGGYVGQISRGSEGWKLPAEYGFGTVTTAPPGPPMPVA